MNEREDVAADRLQCSGSWPCRHCVDRRVVSRCHFRLDEADVSHKAPKKRPRRIQRDHQADGSVDGSEHVFDTPIDLKTLGYAKTPAHLSVAHQQRTSTNGASHANVNEASKAYDDDLREALRALPQRSLTGESFDPAAVSCSWI